VNITNMLFKKLFTRNTSQMKMSSNVASNVNSINCSLTSLRVIKYLLICMGGVVVAHIATQAFSLISGYDVLMGVIPLFNLNGESNVPAFFSTLLLLGASALLVVNARIYAKNDRWFVKYWLFLAVIFLFLGVDEFSSLHERLTVPVRNLFDTEGVFYFAWIIPYAVLLLCVGLVLLRFMFRIDRGIAVGFVVAGGVFVFGAVGMEMLGGSEAEVSGQATFTFVMLATIEEVMEMSGVIIFIHFILKDMSSRVSRLSLDLTLR